MKQAKTKSTSAAIVEAIADHTDTKPEDLPVPLADVIDPDSLDQLFAGRDTHGTVRFVYEGLQVTVSSDGAVTVREEN